MIIKLEVQKVAASHGWVWITHAYRLIMRSPWLAMSLAMVVAMGMMLAMLVPLGGIFLTVLAAPVFIAGYMRVCRSLEYSEPLEPGFVFAGFGPKFPQLLKLGALILLGLLLVAFVTAALGGKALTGILENFQQNPDPEQLVNALMAPENGLRLVLLVGFALFFILMLAMQFAPMLVFFNHVQPLHALQISLISSVRNIIPFSVYSLIMQVFTFVLGSIPFDLGLIVLLPLMLTSMYVAYRDIFNEVKPEEPAAAA